MIFFLAFFEMNKKSEKNESKMTKIIKSRHYEAKKPAKMNDKKH